MRHVFGLAVLSVALSSACGREQPSHVNQVQAALDDTAYRMYQYVRAKQIAASENPRAIGTWPSRAVAGQIFGGFNRPESNIFIALQMSLALHRVARTHELDGLDEVDGVLSRMFDQYVADQVTTNEPAGSIAHWALYTTTDGMPIRYADVPTRSYEQLKLFDIANDVDTSSQAYLFATQTNGHTDFRDAYPGMLLNWRDLGPRTMHRQEGAWKTAGSGAFLTWNEQDAGATGGTRIPGGVNDVDCVVNLNVLTSIVAMETRAPLSLELVTAKDSTCSLLVSAVQEHDLARCAVYYDETHAFMAYARALSQGVSCLEPARAELLDGAKRLATRVVSARDDVVDQAEMILALKWLAPASDVDRRTAVQPTLDALEAKMRRQLRGRADGTLYLPEGTLYHGTVYPRDGVAISGRWLSESASTVYGIEALTTP